MILKHAEFVNFRNIKKAELVPDSGINVLYGQNAQGKTNFIEGIWLFTGAKSFRGAKDTDMPYFGSNTAKLSAEFVSEGVLREAQIIIDEKRNALFNGKSLKSAAMLAGKFHGIVFSPSDLALVKEGPSVRRRFLDTAIGQLYPMYISALRDYMRAVAQRNNIIRDLRYHNDIEGLADAFDEKIAVCGAQIIDYRSKYTEILKEIVPEIYSGIAEDRETLDIEYIKSCDAEEIGERLKKARNSDIQTGSTSVGPHRDELMFKINGTAVRSFGSQGQQRSVALALKLSEARIIKNICGEFPIALLDDVMSELDPFRQDYILNHIKDWQVFITCCDPGSLNNLKSGKTFQIENGEIK